MDHLLVIHNSGHEIGILHSLFQTFLKNCVATLPKLTYVIWYHYNAICLRSAAKCSGDEFECSDRSCIPHHQVCDGHLNCPDGADEDNCPTRECNEHEFSCGDGHCIPRDFVCDRRSHCKDGSDERDCGKCLLAVTPCSYFINMILQLYLVFRKGRDRNLFLFVNT